MILASAQPPTRLSASRRSGAALSGAATDSTGSESSVKSSGIVTGPVRRGGVDDKRSPRVTATLTGRHPVTARASGVGDDTGQLADIRM